MSFEVFRRHRRKGLAALAILAMFSFVLADSLPRLLTPDYATQDVEVARIFGRSIHLSDLNQMARQRSRANQVASMLGLTMFTRDFFGGLKQRDLIDALILEKEADRLGMPADTATGRDWLRAVTNNRINRETFEQLYAPFSGDVTQEQLLADIANQVRLAKVRMLGGEPLVTPYDVYRAYRGQNERVAAKLVEIPVEDFLDKVGEPSSADVQALYDEYKDVLPDPDSPTPGFKIPRRAQVEFVTVDAAARAREIRDKLSDAELHTYYENHKAELKVPSELPEALFADAPDLTPPIVQPFADVRALLADRLADEKAQAEINELFAKIRDEALIPYADAYLTMLDDRAEDPKAKVEEPTPVDLKAIAAKEGIAYEISPMLTREQAAKYGMIAGAQVGSERFSNGRPFVDEIFDAKLGVYEPVELTDIVGGRYLVRKLKDEAPKVPPLDDVRAEVVHAWKLDKARPLAEKAARELAARIKSEKQGKVDEDEVDGHQVLTPPPVARRQSGISGNPFEPAPQVETPIADVPRAGKEFRDAYFGIQEGETAVAPNLPRTTYYVIALDRREPVDFGQFYGPIGEEMRFRSLARQETAVRQDQAWMDRLRRQAGLAADWAPPDELDKDDARG
ncbi:hypothetical protein [Paludisphaera sp.]|uniref:hypothetical protein n=1 Tax=Paludisphaera sp. TaxID=2017432 RepID=UPI00301DF9E8